MPEFSEQDMLIQDQTDLIELLKMRFEFDELPEPIAEKIRSIQQLDVLERLILAAANAADWKVFLDELQDGAGSFKLLGERFDPLG